MEIHSDIRLIRASTEDAGELASMEQDPDTKAYIIPYLESEHRQYMQDSELVYLKIREGARTAGFIILALDRDGRSVEFRRIVVTSKGRGVGQAAIETMEAFCTGELGRNRIWLDVFEHNARGRHIYEKLGYSKFGETRTDDGTLLLYEKELPMSGV